MTSDPVLEQQTFTIGQVVAALQPRFPDVSHSSLRFLEREGLIHSLRTTGGHRLYAADEVARIEQIKRWQGERVSLGEIRERLVSLDSLSNPELLAREYVASAVAGDLRNAGDIIEQADKVGVPLDVVFRACSRRPWWTSVSGGRSARFRLPGRRKFRNSRAN
ncbi:MAG: MerR family transcriptional regulator [Thermomicrobiales bacterium]